MTLPAWHGIPRENIEWHPTVDNEKCTGCGVCFTSCGKKVYGFDFALKKPVVVQPQACMVGCITCANTCLFDAISFPSVKGLRQFMRKSKVLVTVKQELATIRQQQLQT